MHSEEMINGGRPIPPSATTISPMVMPADKPARKRRSEAGTSKPKKEPAAPGKLTREQAERIKELTLYVTVANGQLSHAELAHQCAVDSLEAYLDEITAKP